VTAGGQAGDVPRVGSDQATAPPSVEQHLLQLLMRKQPAVAATTPQQQQALLQLLLQSQVSSAQAARQAPAAGAFSLANLSSTGSAAASVPTSQVPRPRAIKSQHSQPLPDAVLQQQQQALQQDLLKTEAAKLAEASKLAELRYIISSCTLHKPVASSVLCCHIHFPPAVLEACSHFSSALFHMFFGSTILL